MSKGKQAIVKARVPVSASCICDLGVGAQHPLSAETSSTWLFRGLDNEVGSSSYRIPSMLIAFTQKCCWHVN